MQLVIKILYYYILVKKNPNKRRFYSLNRKQQLEKKYETFVQCFLRPKNTKHDHMFLNLLDL